MSSDADDRTDRLLTEMLRSQAEGAPLPPERYEWLEPLRAGRHGWDARRLALVAVAVLCLVLLVGGLTPPGRVAARGVKRVLTTITSTITNDNSSASTPNAPAGTRAVPQGSAQTGSVTALPTTGGTASAIAPSPPTHVVTTTTTTTGTRPPTQGATTVTPTAVPLPASPAGGNVTPLLQLTAVPSPTTASTRALATNAP